MRALNSSSVVSLISVAEVKICVIGKAIKRLDNPFAIEQVGQ